MSRRRKNPHCFYCNEATDAGITSVIDGRRPVCPSCSDRELIDPQSMFDAWLAHGGDRGSAILFAQCVNDGLGPFKGSRVRVSTGGAS